MKEPLLTLAVLAGGAGTRMGQPKAWLTLHDQPILNWLMTRWNWSGPTLLVTAPGREHPPGAELFDREAVDAVADQGPLRGMVTALEASETEIVVLATCDMPLVQREQLEWLAIRFAGKCDSLGLFLRRAERIEPFPCTMRREAIGLLKSRLESNDRSIHSLMDLPQFQLIDAPAEWPAEAWRNLNWPEGLESLERSLD